jgi:hypothetical protein
MALYADLLAQDYLDRQYGVVSNAPHSSCDNYNLFSAEAMEIAGWEFWPQYVSFYKASEIEPGLITRYPHRENGGISQDEMIGAATLDQQAAERIYEYGQNHFWYFNPDKQPFSLSLWFGRFLDFKPYIKHAAGHKLNIFQQLAWAIMTVLSPMSDPGNTSGKLLKWTQLRRMENHYFICDVAIKWWRYRMTREYPGGLKSVMGIYFGSDHPMTKYARNDFQ